MPEPNGDNGQQTGAQGDQSGSQQQTGQSTGQQATGQQQSGNSNGAQGQQTAGDQGTARTGATSGYTYQEDRSKWIPPHRLTETSRRAQELEQQLQQANDRIRALAGVEPTDPQSQKAEQIREAFFNLPGMQRFKKLLDLPDEDFEALLTAPNAVQRTTQAEARQWERHGDAQVAGVSERVAEVIGADSLDADQQADLRVAFSAWLRAAVKADVDKFGLEDVAESQTLRRYESGDPKLLDEFVARYTKNWLKPGQRQAAAQTATRTRPVPNSAGRSQVTQIRRPDKFNSLDERLDYAVNLAKERGVQFGR